MWEYKCKCVEYERYVLPYNVQHVQFVLMTILIVNYLILLFLRYIWASQKSFERLYLAEMKKTEYVKKLSIMAFEKYGS